MLRGVSRSFQRHFAGVSEPFWRFFRGILEPFEGRSGGDVLEIFGSILKAFQGHLGTCMNFLLSFNKKCFLIRKVILPIFKHPE